MNFTKIENIKLGTLAILTSLATVLPDPAKAQDFKGTIGVGGISGPTFSGSDETAEGFGLDVDLEWRETYFLNQRGAGAYVYQPDGEDGLRLGFALGYDFASRSVDDDDRLAGLTEVEAGAVFTSFVEYEFGIADFELEVSQGLGDTGHQGLTAKAAVEFTAPIGQQAFVSLSPFVKWGDDTYTNALYGVSSADSLSSGFAEYEAGSGIESYGLALSAGYQFTETVGVFGSVDYSVLAGDAADSPIVFQEDQTSVAVGVFYSF